MAKITSGKNNPVYSNTTCWLCRFSSAWSTFTFILFALPIWGNISFHLPRFESCWFYWLASAGHTSRYLQCSHSWPGPEGSLRQCTSLTAQFQHCNSQSTLKHNTYMYKPSATDFVFIEIINTGQTWILWFGAGMTSMLISAYSGCAVLEHQNINWHCLKNYLKL